MTAKSCNLADHWQELLTRCGFSVSIDERGVHVSENCGNGRHGWFPDGITAISAFHLEIIENIQEAAKELKAENARLKAKVSDEDVKELWEQYAQPFVSHGETGLIDHRGFIVALKEFVASRSVPQEGQPAASPEEKPK